MKKKLNILLYILIIIIISIICALYLTKKFSNKLYKSIYSYGESEINKIVSTTINKSLTENIENKIEKLYDTKNNSKEEILDFNTKEINALLLELTNNIERNLIEISETNKYDNKDIICLIPLGAVTGNIFLSNLGIKIPLKISFISNILSEINTDIQEYGLNNALLKISIKVTINAKIIAPYTSKELTIENLIPVSINLIQGEIPDYYINSLK